MSDFAKDTNVPINDCISRQAVIDALDEMETDIATGEFSYEKWRKYFVEMPSADHKQKWILVTERLPEDDGWYLVSLGNAWSRLYPFGKIVRGKKIYESNVRLSHFENGNFYHGMVVAWMPLPAPYTEERKEP